MYVMRNLVGSDVEDAGKFEYLSFCGAVRTIRQPKNITVYSFLVFARTLTDKLGSNCMTLVHRSYRIYLVMGTRSLYRWRSAFISLSRAGIYRMEVCTTSWTHISLLRDGGVDLRTTSLCSRDDWVCDLMSCLPGKTLVLIKFVN